MKRRVEVHVTLILDTIVGVHEAAAIEQEARIRSFVAQLLDHAKIRDAFAEIDLPIAHARVTSVGDVHFSRAKEPRQ